MSDSASVPPSPPAAWVAATAGIVGGIGLFGGFFGPLLLVPSNLGPLIGIFFTGPAGALLGALLGCALWARRAPGPLRAAWAWILAIWGAGLLYTLFMVRFTSWGLLAGAVVQAGALVAMAWLLRQEGALPGRLRACRWVILTTVGLVLFMTLFPPVTRPWWGAPSDPARSAGPLPPVAFVFDAGFDASRHVPRFAIDLPWLAAEWCIALAAGGIACLALRPRRAGHPVPGV